MDRNLGPRLRESIARLLNFASLCFFFETKSFGLWLLLISLFFASS